ncbi:MAG TPA: hypothetical protein VLO11_07170, partial [Luteolibacter sp.]|nr:hypothetical protein [Luteolibacter sp.]
MLHSVPASFRVESKWLFLGVGAAIGLLAGHFSGSLQSVASGGTNSPEVNAIRVRGKERSAVAKDDRLLNSRLAQIREMAASGDYKVRDDFTESLGGADVPDLLAAFLADMALDGIDYKQRKMLEQAVHRWVADDIDAALAWAASLAQPKQRRYFQKMMLNEFAKTDPFRAADQALEIEAGDPDFDASLIVSSAIRELAKSGNEREIADLVRK